MTAADPLPSFPASGAPISLLIDFDGTISLHDVGDELLARLGPDAAEVARIDRLYDAKVIGSRELMAWDMDVLPRDADLLRREIQTMDLDPTFVGLVELVQSVGGVVEVVSDGLGFHVEPMLARVGLADLPVATNSATPGLGGEGVTFPYGHPVCHVCGTCKRERVRVHRSAARAVVFVGDGTSDRYAAHHADVVFAKDALATWCDEVGIHVERWDRLADVTRWLREALAAGRLPATPAGFAAWAEWHRRAETFICGPEVMAGSAQVSAPGPSGIASGR